MGISQELIKGYIDKGHLEGVIFIIVLFLISCLIIMSVQGIYYSIKYRKIKKTPLIPKTITTTEDIFVEPEYTMNLEINYKSGEKVGWASREKVKNNKNNEKLLSQYISFYRWFYEKESPYCSFASAGAITVIIRSEIKRIDLLYIKAA
jgi:hypothetical protein